MPKKPTFQELALQPSANGQPLFRWIYQELRAAVLDGRLPAGSRLPSTRNLAAQYGVARGTVLIAFEQLQAEGYLEGRVGAGTFVSRNLPDRSFHAAAPARKAERKTIAKAPKLSNWSQRFQSPFPLRGESKVGIPFQPNQPALDLFPMKLWSQLFGRRLRQASRVLLASGDAWGYRPLREAVAAHLGSARGIQCSTDQIVIVSGSQQALDLSARLTLDPGDQAWVEDPGYSGAVAAISAAGGKIVPVPVDEDGMDVSQGIQKAPRARMAYVTPAHQFPLGISLALERRMQLLAWSRNSGAWIFEDDYDSDYRFVGRPLPAMLGLAPESAVIFAGSFNKLLFPSLRLGYVVLPPVLVEPFCRARSVTDRFAPVLDQAVLCDFIAEGHFGQHLRRMREAYAERLEVLLEALAPLASHGLHLEKIHAGMQIAAQLPRRLRDRDIAALAQAAGIHAIPLSVFQIERRDINGLLLGFAGIEPDAIRQGAEQLGAVLRQRDDQK